MNPNINIRQPLNLEKEIMRDRIELFKMAMILHQARIDNQLDKLDNDIKELRELLEDV